MRTEHAQGNKHSEVLGVSRNGFRRRNPGQEGKQRSRQQAWAKTSLPDPCCRLFRHFLGTTLFIARLNPLTNAGGNLEIRRSA